MVEEYWLALLRDVPFSQYGGNPLAQAAAIEVSGLSDFRGPKASNGQIPAATLFRGGTPGDLIGPYISQFLYVPIAFGAALVNQQFQTYLPVGAVGADFMTDTNLWLAARNGQGPFPAQPVDPVRRYLRSGRDLCQWVHMDILFESYMHACVALLGMGVPLNPSNPYTASATQTGFGTFGAPAIQAQVAEVASRALKAVWYQKWYVHRALRPEEMGGLVHYTLTGARNYPLHQEILKSQAVRQVFARTGSYLLPQAFPEGCPQHPSYGSGHATVAGASITVLKAFFDETYVIPNPLVSTDDGLALIPYTGSDAGQMTVLGELNKLASNVGIGRNTAGIHWRSDYAQGVMLGEALAISIMKDTKPCYNQQLANTNFTKFDGTTAVI